VAAQLSIQDIGKLIMSKDNEYYRFESELRYFLSRLIGDNPIDAQPTKYLKKYGLYREPLINALIRRGILERHEKILDRTNSDEKTSKYVVKYKVRRKNFNRNVYKMFISYFEKNLPEKKIDEEDGGGATGCSTVGDYAFSQPMNKKIINRPIVAENKKPLKKVYITQKQYDYICDKVADKEYEIKEATTTMNVGAVGDYDANGLVLKTSDGKKDPSYDR
jgi:hypothetical protein